MTIRLLKWIKYNPRQKDSLKDRQNCGNFGRQDNIRYQKIVIYEGLERAFLDTEQKWSKIFCVYIFWYNLLAFLRALFSPWVSRTVFNNPFCSKIQERQCPWKRNHWEISGKKSLFPWNHKINVKTLVKERKFVYNASMENIKVKKRMKQLRTSD